MSVQWRKIAITTTPEALDILSGIVVSYGISGVEIEDPEDFRAFVANPPLPFDYIDDSVLAKQNAPTRLVFYLENTSYGVQNLSNIKREISSLAESLTEIDFGALSYFEETIEQADFESAWKKHYHPIEIGQRLLICPVWEADRINGSDRVAVVLDPDMAFGTGNHETTQLCLELLEQKMKPNSTLLDIGTGSGILAIAALKLGASRAIGVDIDQRAMAIATANAITNGVGSSLQILHSQQMEEIHDRFDIICMNIVADVIISLLPSVARFMKPTSTLLLSGIIEDRLPDVLTASTQAGFLVSTTRQKNGWIAMELLQNG